MQGRGTRRRNRRLRIPSEEVCRAGLMLDKGPTVRRSFRTHRGMPLVPNVDRSPIRDRSVPKRHTIASLRMGRGESPCRTSNPIADRARRFANESVPKRHTAASVVDKKSPLRAGFFYPR
jgi:hypothetical protein